VSTRAPPSFGRQTKTMSTLPYREGFQRIRAEFFETPGLHLTPGQVGRVSGLRRVSGLNSAVRKCVLDNLVRARLLGAFLNRQLWALSDTENSRSRPQRQTFLVSVRTRQGRAAFRLTIPHLDRRWRLERHRGERAVWEQRLAAGSHVDRLALQAASSNRSNSRRGRLPSSRAALERASVS
jgi:hypothetical protein